MRDLEWWKEFETLLREDLRDLLEQLGPEFRAYFSNNKEGEVLDKNEVVEA